MLGFLSLFLRVSEAEPGLRLFGGSRRFAAATVAKLRIVSGGILPAFVLAGFPAKSLLLKFDGVGSIHHCGYRQ